MKIFAAIAAGAILVALAFLHPAPHPALTVSSPGAMTSSRGVMVSSTGVMVSLSNHGRAKSRPPAALVVYVAGDVSEPGLYRVAPGARANDAVLRAGGFTTHADPAAVNLAEPVQDGEEIHVPKLGECSSASRKRTTRGKRSRTRAANIPLASIDLNAADAVQLARLPGLGETLAARIVAYRMQNGPFASLDELADVSGMTQRRVDAIARYLSI